MNKTERKHRIEKEGIVISNKMKNTVVVEVSRLMQHPEYNKVVRRKTKCYAHCEKPLAMGDKVKIRETRPLSKLKRWVVISE